MGDVEISNNGWQYEYRHHMGLVDVFRLEYYKFTTLMVGIPNKN